MRRKIILGRKQFEEISYHTLVKVIISKIYKVITKLSKNNNKKAQNEENRGANT